MLIVEEDKVITESGFEITEPAILYYNTGLFYKFGNYKELYNIQKKYSGLVLMVFDTVRLSLKEIVNIVNGMKEHSCYAISLESSDIIESII